ncbi:MAG: 3-ketoacyl-ACP reductase [Victivallales bacterium]|nr:3-ketoacyl-ACP reductase [Victivallales bacterium]
MKKTALVTGAAGGIGFACVKTLLDHGFAVAGMGRHDNLPETPAGDFLYYKGDVRLDADRRGFVAAAKERFGRIDVLVNVAGIAPKVRRDLLEMTEESYDEVMGVNLKGTLFLTQLAANEMIKNEGPNRGAIVNISSMSAYTSSVNRGEYCISKAGVSMATRLWAVRLAEYGIPVYEIRPGVIKSDMTAAVEAKYDRLISEGLCLQPRWGFPEDIGRAVAMLLRGDLPYSTGQVINVDGGMSIQKL